MPILKESVGKAFLLSKDQRDSLNFVQLYEYSDVLLAENMEGSKPRFNFTSLQWHYIREVQKLVLTMPFSDFARDLWLTKQFKKPLTAMRKRVAEIINDSTDRNTLRYFLYSAHDV